jgi:hypothetical protein
MSEAWGGPCKPAHAQQEANDETFWIYQMERRFA